MLKKTYPVKTCAKLWAVSRRIFYINILYERPYNKYYDTTYVSVFLDAILENKKKESLPIATSDITNILNASFAKKIAHKISVLFGSVSASTNVEFPNFCSLAISVLIWYTTCCDTQGSCSIRSIHHLLKKNDLLFS